MAHLRAWSDICGVYHFVSMRYDSPYCEYSSVGRAGVLYTPGPWFESMYSHKMSGANFVE